MGTHSQSDDLESRQPHLRRSCVTAQLYCGLRHFFVKAKIREQPLHPPEGSETQTLDQNLCCYSYISAKYDGAMRAHPDR